MSIKDIIKTNKITIAFVVVIILIIGGFIMFNNKKIVNGIDKVQSSNGNITYNFKRC